MDWDKLKVFHAAAEAGSFTHAGEQLGLSQSAVSRQVGALEQELSVPLFHRHARGLILTEQGELLYRTAHDVLMKLEAARTQLSDSREKPNGELRVNTTPGLGVHWLTPRLGEFLDLYPDIRMTLITTEQELDLAMREADVAIRLRPPTQPDLIQRKLFSMHFHAYVSPEYLKRHGTPRTPEDLDHHRLLVLGGSVPNHLQSANWVIRSPARLSARARGRHAAGLSHRAGRRPGAALRPHRRGGGRRLFRLRGGDEVGRPHPGIPRFSRLQGATLALLRVVADPPHISRISHLLREPHGWHARRCVAHLPIEVHSSRAL
jgi:DNA-binding transcriptional LysR family regulator